jgi:hypothetical protein
MFGRLGKFERFNEFNRFKRLAPSVPPKGGIWKLKIEELLSFCKEEMHTKNCILCDLVTLCLRVEKKAYTKNCILCDLVP